MGRGGSGNRTNRPSSSSTIDRSKPAFTTAGSFDALIVEDVSSESESEQGSPLTLIEIKPEKRRKPTSEPSTAVAQPPSSSRKRARPKKTEGESEHRKDSTTNNLSINLRGKNHQEVIPSKHNLSNSEKTLALDNQISKPVAIKVPATQNIHRNTSSSSCYAKDKTSSSTKSSKEPVTLSSSQDVIEISSEDHPPSRFKGWNRTKEYTDRAEKSKMSIEDCETLSTSTSSSYSNSRTNSISTTDYDDEENDVSVELLRNNDHQALNSENNGQLNQDRSKNSLDKLGSYLTETRASSEKGGLSMDALQDRAEPTVCDTPSTEVTPVNTAFSPSTTRKSSIFENQTFSEQSKDTSKDITSKYGADHAPGKKWKTIATRVIWSLVMVCGFIGLMTLGHVYLIVLVFIIQLSVFREVSNLFEVGYKASAREHARKQASAIQAGHQALSLAAKERRRIKDVDKNRWSKVMSWYFFCAVNYFLYGESIIYYFKHVVFIDAYLLPFARHHRFISLLLYLVGFLAFVANLDRGHLRRQFGLFSWIHMSLLLIVASGQFMVNNILEGLIWFWIPASLVIMNDVAAYVFGMLFGKHQLIKLSPKKTVEGFIGGYFTTVIFSVLWGSLFMGWNYMICPVRDLGMTAFSDVQCTPNNAFVWRAYNFPETLVKLISLVGSSPPSQVWYTPFQLHCLVLGTFAGLVAPFGGFFASGFKRAFNIKDFADTIPGHGGLTDRFDCQFIMGLFTYFYYTSMVREQHVTIGSILEMIASSLSLNEQYELYQDLGKSLVAQGIKI